jgi:general secretion pathway protein J
VKAGSVTAADDRGRQRCREQGFTLVEVMVALTILSLILMATVSALRTLATTQVTLEKTTDRVDEVRSVSIFLRDILESAVVANDSEFSLGGGENAVSYFHSGTDFLEFESTILFGEYYGGSYLIRVAKEDAKLVLRWQESPVDRVPQDWIDKPSRVLVEHLEELTVATREEYAMEWTDRRRNDDLTVPALVKLNVKAAGRYWPELIMQVRR